MSRAGNAAFRHGKRIETTRKRGTHLFQTGTRTVAEWRFGKALAIFSRSSQWSVRPLRAAETIEILSGHVTRTTHTCAEGSGLVEARKDPWEYSSSAGTTTFVRFGANRGNLLKTISSRKPSHAHTHARTQTRFTLEHSSCTRSDSRFTNSQLLMLMEANNSNASKLRRQTSQGTRGLSWRFFLRS